MSGYGFRGNYTTRLRKGLRKGCVVYFGKKLADILEQNNIDEFFLQEVTKKGIILKNEPYEKKFRYVEILPKAPKNRRHAKVKVENGCIKIPYGMVIHANLKKGGYCIIGDVDGLKLWNAQKCEKLLETDDFDNEMQFEINRKLRGL